MAENNKEAENNKANVKKSVTDIQAVNLPNAGSFTFKQEGHEGGPFASRYLHVPDNNSGLTIGRGYDMKEKTKTQILSDFIRAEISQEDAEKFGDAVKLKGDKAKEFIKKNKLEEFSITPIQQAKLFEISFKFEEGEVKRICTTDKERQRIYGKVEWEKLNPAIKEIITDLKFRGDYTPETRKILQKHVADNNLEELAKVIQDQNNWDGKYGRKVPLSRFKERSKFMEEQLKIHKSETPLSLPKIH